MAKDPAFLFYYQDFLVGTEFMSEAEVGIYIKMLCHMADKGRLSKDHMLNICKTYDFTKNLQSKFKVDDDGFYFNERLLHEVEKRRKYTESRRNNRKGSNHMLNICKTYDKHMENENINSINSSNNSNSSSNTYSINTIDNIKDNINNKLIELWIKTWGRTPKMPEYEETENLIKKFGDKKVEKIFRAAVLRGFKGLQGVLNNLDATGNLLTYEEKNKPEEEENIKQPDLG